MQITDVKIFMLKEEKRGLKAFASITIDNSLVIQDLRIINTARGYIVAMPSRKLPNGEYKETVFPISTELSEHITGSVLRVFQDEKCL